ncbi:response regulator transcription factor [Sphingomonas sp. SUN039]|uniref:response regulator transcription factor n=1 Tax=Sphingomonas sp. SUN039 TaxID=2937787 RepID=UPI0021643A57|nr:response regulator transcription factor [Sphingomonas sp. SUN039]UVO53749.1 response regulator transcription factor [Sphingomonas sp. SUN039]
MRILLIEDSATVASQICEGLGLRGHDVVAVGDGAAGFERARATEWDALIVDRMLPSMDGLLLVKTLRSEGVRTPALFLTALGLVEDRVEGFEAGGDDYLVKPFAMAELVARVEALGRRESRLFSASQSLADLTIDRLARTVTRGDRIISLQAREYELLDALLTETPNVVTRTMLLERVWKIRFDPGTNLIESHISRLRSKIDVEGTAPIIHTIRGEGYAARLG